MSHESRTTLTAASLALSVLASAVACAGTTLLAVMVRSHFETKGEMWPWVLRWFLGGLGVAVLCGLPLFIVLRWIGLARWWVATLMGAILGGVPVWAWDNMPEAIALAAVTGAVSAYAFWLASVTFGVRARAT